jgi:outer membrane biosynthesis protein TonB
MRVGLAVSIIGHAAILGFGFLAFPEARPFVVTEIEALPVDLIEVADETDLLAGDKKSEQLPEEKPQPKPEVAAALPSPEPAEKPAERPVESAREPTPPPPPPPQAEAEPEAEPAPEPEAVAALPDAKEPALPEDDAEPLPEAEPKPEERPPVEARTPRARPDPPKQVARLEPPKTRSQPVEPPETRPEFNPDDITALLNKQEPAGGGDPLPAEEPQTLGSIDGRAEAAMTQSELAALQARLYQCWSPPVAVREAGALVVTVRILLLPDGSLAGEPQIIDAGFHPLSQIASESAVRAVVQCAPFGDILRPEKYALWQQIDFVFDPRQMLGG